jgi:hypothetical protein
VVVGSGEEAHAVSSIEFRRFFAASVLLVAGAGAPGCRFLDQASAGDAAESYHVVKYVNASGVVPETACVARSHTASRRFLEVVGVEDREIQDEIVDVAAQARRQYSTKPLVVIFFAGRVVKDRSGGARFPDGVQEIRRETIP